MSKTQLRVLNWMRKTGSITQKEATDNLGVSRLAAAICELKKQGVPIKSEYITVPNRWGEPCRVKRYYYAASA